MILLENTPLLQKLINKDVPDGYSLLITGPTGSLKTTLVSQILYTQLRYKSTYGLYFEMSGVGEKLVDHLMDFGIYLNHPLIGNRVIIYNVLEEMLREMDRPPMQIVYDAVQICCEDLGLEVEYMVLDPLDPLLMKKRIAADLYENIGYYISSLKKYCGNLFLIITENSLTRPFIERISVFVDGWIRTRKKYDQKSRLVIPLVKIEKMKGIPHTMQIYPMILTKRGLIVGERI